MTARKKKKVEAPIVAAAEGICGNCNKALGWPGHTFGELMRCRDALDRKVQEARREGELIMSQFS